MILNSPIFVIAFFICIICQNSTVLKIIQRAKSAFGEFYESDCEFIPVFIIGVNITVSLTCKMLIDSVEYFLRLTDIILVFRYVIYKLL